jgi:hypothetical protein
VSNEDSAVNEESSSGLIQPDKAVDVALAEFNALRTEIVNHMTAQATLTGVGLTALGVILGFALRGGGDRELLLTIPLLATLVSLLHAGINYQITLIAGYIRTTLWPYLQGRVDEELPSWETYIATQRRPWGNFALAHLIGTPAIGLFVAASVVALLLAPANADPRLRNAGWGLTLLTILCVSRVIRMKRLSDRCPDE